MKYQIKHHIEEATCAHCGEPLYVGDTAYEHDDAVFCCRRCVAAWEMEPRQAYLCQFCEENYVHEPDMLCMSCSRFMADRADRADHINRCD